MVVPLLQARNLSVVTARAINASGGSIVGAESVDRMIEHVEGIHAELRAEPLRDPNFLTADISEEKPAGPVK